MGVGPVVALVPRCTTEEAAQGTGVVAGAIRASGLISFVPPGWDNHSQ